MTYTKDRVTFVYELQKQLNIGLANGDRYTTMAKRVSQRCEIAYRRSMLIVRTETHRVREKGFLDSAEEINGILESSSDPISLVKTWNSMEDERIRDTEKANHRVVDGVSVGVDDVFTLKGGVTAKAPGSSGTAYNDCNCRCFLSFEMKSVDKSGESGIIKNIEISDIQTAAKGSTISKEVVQVVYDTLKKSNSQFIFDDVAVVKVDPKIIMQTDPVRKGTFFDTRLNLNENFLGGKTVEEINNKLKGTDFTVANTLEEAITHELYHAKLISGLNQAELEALYDELSDIHIKGISPTAWKDGSECIAETGVLFERGETEKNTRRC